MTTSSSLRRWTALAFALSGLSALIYEVTWLEKIQLVMGHTVYSIATTLSAYLAGLGLGAVAAPRWSRLLSGVRASARQTQKGLVPAALVAYVIAEGGIGVYGLLFPWVSKAILWPYDFVASHLNLSLGSLSVLQFVACGLCLLPPTFLMGMTLPLLSDALFPGKDEASQNLPWLYAMNTLGAALGSLVTGFALIPSLGISRTLGVAVLCNFTLLIGALLLAPRNFETKMWRLAFSALLRSLKELTSLSPFHPRSSLLRAPAGFVLFASGITTLLVQFVWNRLAALSFGPSITIFPTVTAVLLLGLGLGSLLARKLVRHEDRAQRTQTLAVVTFLAGCTLYASTALFSFAPVWVLEWHLHWKPEFWGYSALSALALIVLIGPSSVVLGLLFPLALSTLTTGQRGSRATRLVGQGYAINVLGLLLGSAFGSFLLIPQTGVETTLAIAAEILVLTALGIFFVSLNQSILTLAATVTAAVVFWVTPAWDWNTLVSGFFYNRNSREGIEAQIQASGWTSASEYARSNLFHTLDRRDDPHATVSIHQPKGDLDPTHRLFKINGKVDGNASSDLETTRLLTLFPALVREDYRNALVIGLGTGSSASKALQYPELKKLQIIELSEAMIDFSKRYFRGTDGDLWSDPRTQVTLRDGREFLEHSSETFDLILSEPSNPWAAGVASLFTREYFESVAKHLTPDRGVFSLWFHGYNLDCVSVNSVLRSAVSVFPNLVVLRNSGDYFMLASSGETLPYLDDQKSELSPLKRDLLRQLGAAEVLEPGRPAALTTLTRALQTSFVISGDGLREKLGLLHRTGENTPDATELEAYNTDDRPVLQYRSGRTFFQKISCNYSNADASWSELARIAFRNELNQFEKATATATLFRGQRGLSSESSTSTR